LPQLQKLGYLEKGMVSEGIYRIIKGMIKKLLIADLISKFIVTLPFETPGDYSSLELWIALYSYTIQIYYDFSAYTDIAIGSALLFGIRLPENFFRPYKATSVAEFWRRWHRTLSDWIRDYIYYPLGGSQGLPTWKIYRNIMATLIIIGIWHGASWNFVIYGCLHGVAVSINRWQRKRTGRKAGMPFPNAFAWFWRFFLTFHFVVLARILFKAPDLSIASEYFSNLWLNEHDFFSFKQDVRYISIAVLGFAIHFSPEKWEVRAKEIFSAQKPLLQASCAAVISGMCLWWLSNSEHASTFIYYSF
jgi:D-alanyl-lipoteichoic acid acyltransferase DltB (MBOAT superfamily)